MLRSLLPQHLPLLLHPPSRRFVPPAAARDCVPNVRESLSVRNVQETPNAQAAPICRENASSVTARAVLNVTYVMVTGNAKNAKATENVLFAAGPVCAVNVTAL